MYRLLIADDEKLERNALRYIIQKGSPAIDEIRDASNGRDAVSVAARFRPEVCFLDIKMPGLSGIEAAKRIKELLPGVRVVFLTAFDYFDYAKEAIRIGVEDFIIKPASDNNVIEVIERITRALDTERSSRERTERVERKLDQVAAAMETELSEGIVHGFVAPEKLTEFAALREFRFESVVAARVVLDYSSYPMKIQGDVQEGILRKRCLRLLQNMLDDFGWLVIAATASEGLRAVCLLPEGARPREAFEQASRRIRRELAIQTITGISLPIGELREVEEALSQAQAALYRGIARPGEPVRSYEDLDTKRVESTALEESASSAHLFPPDRLEERLISAFLSDDRRMAQAALDDVYFWFSSRVERPAELGVRMRDFFVVVRHSLVRLFPRLSLDGEVLSQMLSGVSGADGIRAAAQGYVSRLFAALGSVNEQSLPLPVRRTREFIDSHYDEELSLGRLAELVSRSPYHLSRLFTQHVGVTVVAYTNSVRISRAKQLLSQAKLTVKEVSLRVGYSDPAYFARLFRRTEGVSPSEYRSRFAALDDPAK